MSSESLQQMEMFYMALADKTRLRLLNLMSGGEVCVCFFTEVLGESQPKISRHLAYLRNAGIVKARRDGKWMHYSIDPPSDNAAKLALQAALNWIGGLATSQADREKYKNICCSPEALVQIARTPMPFIYEHTDITADERRPPEHEGHNELEEFLL